MQGYNAYDYIYSPEASSLPLNKDMYVLNH